MAFLESGFPGEWHSWRFAFLEICIPGDWHSWRLAFLEIGIRGDHLHSWRLASLEIGILEIGIMEIGIRKGTGSRPYCPVCHALIKDSTSVETHRESADHSEIMQRYALRHFKTTHLRALANT